MSSTALVVLPHGAECLRDELATLSRHGLLRPFVIIGEGGRSELLEAGCYHEHEVADVLRGRKLEIIRVVGARLGVDPSPAQLAQENQLVEWLLPRARAGQVRVHTMTVTALPVDGVLTPAMLQPTWQTNVVLVPEDGPGSRGFVTVDLQPSQLAPMASTAITLVGGLWYWLQEGVLDGETTPMVEDRVFVRLARCFVRLVDADDVGAQLVARAMAPDGTWPLPHDSQGECTPHPSPEELIDTLANSVAVAKELQFVYEPFRSKPRPRPAELGLRRALQLFYRQFVRHLRGLPVGAIEDLHDRVRRGVEGFVQARTYGGDSAIAVRLAGRPTSAAELADTSGRIERMRALPAVVLPAPLPTPEGWAMLRSVAFGLVDGGAFSGSLSGSEPRSQQQRAVIEKRGLVAVAPGRHGANLPFALTVEELDVLGFEAETGTTIAGHDVVSARRLRAALEEAAAKVPPSTGDGDAAVSDETKDGAKDGAEDEAKDETGDREARLNVLSALGTRFGRWCDERNETLLWKLGERLTDATEQAYNEVDAATRDFERVRAEHEREQDQSKRVSKWVRRRTIVLVVGALALGAWSLADRLFGSHRLTLWLLIGALAAVLLLPLSFLSTARRLTRLEFRLRELETEPERIASRRRHAAAEAARLTYLNRQLIDWADILAVTLHRSWGDPVEATARAGSSRPMGVQAIVWGSTSLETARMHNEVMRLRRTLSRRGWATAVYADLLRAWQDAYQGAGGPWSANVDPSSDASQSPRPVVGLANGPELLRPRMDFHSAVVEERHIDAVRLRRIEILRDAVGADASTLLGAVKSHVRQDGLPTPEFLASIIEASPLPDFRDYVVHRVGGPRSSVELSVWSMSEQIRSAPPDDGVTRRRVATTAVPDRFVMASARMDLSGHLEPPDTPLSPSSLRSPPRPPTASSGAAGADDSFG